MNWNVSEDGAMVERECLLFEAGDYPDKGVTVTDADLIAIAANSAEQVPVRIEHLKRSPFDSALGVVCNLRVEGGKLWGTIRQPSEAWKLAQRAGAKHLSVALDVPNRRLLETSFVVNPRVESARVFSSGAVERFTSPGIFETDKEEPMQSLQQFAEGVTAYVRAALGREDVHSADFSQERARLESERRTLEVERARMTHERADRQIADWKREGRIRAAETVEELARTLLTQGEDAVVCFNDAQLPVSALFARFVGENGTVVPMGELIPAVPEAQNPQDARMQLMSKARDMVASEGISYTSAFSRVSTQNPALARMARE